MTQLDENAEFRSELLQDIFRHADAGHEFIEDAFFEVFCEHIMDSGDLAEANRASFRSHRGVRVDGYGGDPANNDDVLTLIAIDYSGAEQLETLTKTALDADFKRLRGFLEKSRDSTFVDALEETSQGFGLADLIRVRWPGIVKVRLMLITDRVLSKRVDGLKTETVDHVSVSQHVWDITRLRNFVESGQRGEPISVDLKGEFGGGVPVLSAHDEEGSYRSYLAAIPGSQLADIYDRWGARLLEQNVRVFLQARGGVNKGIRNTLDNNPGMFFAYNNGLTATAEAVHVSDDRGALRLDHIENLQIVNGGQTTASVHAASRRGADLKRAFIQMKLMIVEPDEATELVPKISEYANTQNKVAAADFFANHPFHVRLEQISRRLHANSADGSVRQTKWFYERARGQYADDMARRTGAEKRKFKLEYPKHQLISKTDLAKFLMVWEQKPDVVSLGAQKNFAAFAKLAADLWDKSEDSVNEEYYRHAVAKAIIFRHTERLVSASSWYDGGYRANIVAYAIAKLAAHIDELSATVDFDKVWREQEVSNELDAALKASAIAAFETITNPNGAKNVTEWAKQQACWAQVKGAKVDWPETLERFLSTKVASDERAAEARAAQRVDNGIEAQTSVVKIDPRTWQEVEKWARQRGLINEKEASILRICASMPNKVPSEKQSQTILKTVRRLREEGCSVAPEL